MQNISFSMRQLMLQIVYPDRYDIVVKYAYFKSILTCSDDKTIEDLYKWIILKRTKGKEPGSTKQTIDDYTKACKTILVSLQENGFDPQHPIKIDQSNRLHGGSHRLSACLALDISPIIQVLDFRKNPRPWGITWFVEKGASQEQVDRIKYEMNNLRSELSS